MSEAPMGDLFSEQVIYESMRYLTKDRFKSSFARRVDKAIEALRENEYYKAGRDVCSVDFLRAEIDRAGDHSISSDPDFERWDRDADSDVKWMKPVIDVVIWMCSKHLQWDEDGGLRISSISFGDNTNVKFRNLYRQLKDIILFVDEAQVKRRLSAGHRADPGAIDRLRFVRNLGRALTMRVVLAGTGATAANLISETPNAASQTDADGELAWIECQFLRKTMSENDVLGVVLPHLSLPIDMQRALISELARGRPYLVHTFDRVMNESFEELHIDSDNLAEVLERVGRQLSSEKSMSYESNLVYLMGVWLDQGRTSPFAFHVKPAELVRRHYFEPCVVLDLKGNPACGIQWGVSSLTSGHLRVKIYRYYDRKAERTMWCASMEDANSEPRAGFCWDFSGIQYSLLRACVQQCLAREPLLAVALSTQCRMSYKGAFREALSTLYQEPSREPTGDSATDGEHILFALLQLASNCQKLTEARVDLGTFLRVIEHYWTNDSSGDSFARGVENICGVLARCGKAGPSQVRLAAISGTRTSKFKISDQTSQCEEYTMPWLVPACSLEVLKQTVDGAPFLFDGIDIAGVVPGGRNAAFNAAAYSWKTLAMEPAWEFKDVAQPEWIFDFRARPSHYNTGDALKELKATCLMQQAILEDEQSMCLRQQDVLEGEPVRKKERWASDHVQPDKLQCHAMLIAATGGHEDHCEIVYSDNGTGKYLRVALVLGLPGDILFDVLQRAIRG